MLRIAIQVKAAHFSWAWHGMAIVESRFDKKCLVVQVFLRPSGMSGEFWIRPFMSVLAWCIFDSVLVLLLIDFCGA